jgi:hypothetical protein
MTIAANGSLERRDRVGRAKSQVNGSYLRNLHKVHRRFNITRNSILVAARPGLWTNTVICAQFHPALVSHFSFLISVPRCLSVYRSYPFNNIMENGRRSGSRPASLTDRDTSSAHGSIGKSATSTVALQPVPPTPAYDASALLIQPSPLMTSSLHSRNSATTAQESAYLKQAKYLRLTRAALSALIIAAGIATVACEGHVLHRYNSTRPGSQYHLPPLWPVNVDIRPTLAILISAVLIVLMSLVYLVLSFIPTVRPPFLHPNHKY